MPSKEKFSSPVRLLKPAEHDQHRTESGFVGRERELAELRAALDDTHGGRGRLFLISGEPGIGKTRLADELAGDAAASRGMRVVWGRCWEGGGAPAYLPWIDVLRSLILDERRDRERHSALPAEIAQLIPELSSETTMPRVPADPAQARFRLFDAIKTLLKQVASSAPLLVVLDDLHEADHGSLELLKFVARGLTDSRIVIVGTHRDAEVRRSSYLSETVGEILRHGHAIPLGGLDQNEVTQMVEDRAQRSPSAAFASELYRVTAGNPLFVDGVVRVLLAERSLGNSDRFDLRGFKLPEDVRGAIRKRLGLLSPQAQSVLAIAAVVGQEFDIALVRRISDLSAGASGELMDEASEVGVVTLSSHDSYRFTHPLIRESLYKGLTEAERTRLHRAIGEALEQLHAANLTPHLAELAHHFFEAAVDEKAIRYSIGAGDAAYAVFAYAEAGANWKAAVRLIDLKDGDDSRRVSVLMHLGDEMVTPGPKAIDYLEGALRASEKLGDWPSACEAHIRIGVYCARPNMIMDLPRAFEHLRKAEELAAQDPSGVGLAWVLIARAGAFISSNAVDDGIATARRAIELCERADGIKSLQIYTAFELGLFLVKRGHVRQGLEMLNHASIEADATDDVTIGSMVAVNTAILLVMLGDPREAQARLNRQLARDQTAHSPFRRSMTHHILSMACAETGELAEVDRHDKEWVILTSPVSAWPLDVSRLFYRGDWDSARKLAEQCLDGWIARGSLEMAIAVGFILVRLHRMQEEYALAKEVCAQVLSMATPHGDVASELRGTAELALICAIAGPTEEASRYLARCREIVDGGEDWRGLGGHFHRAAGVCAAAVGDSAKGEQHFATAIDIFRRFTLPWEEAETLLYWGRALATGDARASEKFDAALEIYKRPGAGQRWVDRVESDRQASACSSVAQRDNGTSQSIFRKEGEYWKTAYEGGSANVRERGGMRFIALLLARPGEDIPAIEMFAALSAGARISPAQDGLRTASDLGDAGEEFDARALSEYRRRLAEVESEIEAAEASHDSGAVARARAEKEMLLQEISSGTRLDGGLRRVASHRERARVNVTRQIKSAIDAVRKVNPALGRHLANSISTGSTCRYAPAERINWQL